MNEEQAGDRRPSHSPRTKPGALRPTWRSSKKIAGKMRASRRSRGNEEASPRLSGVAKRAHRCPVAKIRQSITLAASDLFVSVAGKQPVKKWGLANRFPSMSRVARDVARARTYAYACVARGAFDNRSHEATQNTVGALLCTPNTRRGCREEWSPMAGYYPVISRAVAALETNSLDARRDIYSPSEHCDFTLSKF